MKSLFTALSSSRTACSVVLASIFATGGSVHADEVYKDPNKERDAIVANDPFPEPDIRDDDPMPGPFDRKLIIPAKTYELGTLFYRTQHQKDWTLGVFNLEMGQELRTPKFPLYFVSTRAASIRMYDGKSYGVSFFQDFGGGIALGPIEPEIHIGANLFELDAFHGDWNVSTLSPRVSAEVGIRIGKARIEVVGFSQYLWRWWGNESYFVRGVSIGIQVDQVKMRHLLP